MIPNVEKIYFVGIGGIGMSALARYCAQHGMKVAGYDKTRRPFTEILEAEGIQVFYTDELGSVWEDADMVVYTPAIPKDSVILNYYEKSGKPLLKRSDLLQLVTEKMKTVAVAGTHGKTTTSTMIAHILRHSKIGGTAFLGGISVDYNTNYWSEGGDIAIVEADEYDRSFLKLSPEIAVLTAIDADHLDIYGTEAELINAYMEFTNRVKPGGTLIYKHEIKDQSRLGGDFKISYSLQNDAADCYASNVMMKDGGYLFDMFGHFMLQRIQLNIGGMHNVENCVAAVAVAKTLGVRDNDILAAIADFKGIKRRFEYIVKTDKTVYIDDYAHHPEELRSLIKSAKTLFRNKKCVVIFQPHLYSRTRDFASEFAAALDMADEVLLMPIYPAREQPIVGITSQSIADDMGNPNHTILNKNSILNYVKSANIELLITAGAGDIDELVPEIKRILEEKK